MVDEGITRVGYLHIPGTMGTSIGSALAHSLNVRYFPVHRVSSEDIIDPYTMQIPSDADSLSRHILLSYPLIAGHLSIGQIHATYRTHIFTVITEPRQRLIKLFNHHAAEGLSFSDWLTQRVNFQSDIIDVLSNGAPIFDMHWSQLHAISHRKPSHPNWSYDFELVEKLVAPIDFIFLARNPQFVVDCLFQNKVLPRESNAEHLNLRNTNRQVNWGDLKEGFKVLKHVTINDYKFIDHISSNARVDPQFETWDDPKTWQFLMKIAEN